MKPLCTLILALMALTTSVAPAAARVEVDGTGETAFTNSTTNRQWFKWDATGQGFDAYRLHIRWLKDGAQVEEARYVKELSDTAWIDWSGVATLEEGHRYEICVRGEYSFPGDPAFFPDGPDTCAADDGKRSGTTIDRTAPVISVTAAGGAEATKSLAFGLSIGFQDNLAGPFPGNFLCVTAGSSPCDQFVLAGGCSVPSASGKDTTFSCTVTPPAMPDGAVTTCVRAADASVPDSATPGNVSWPAGNANISTVKCDTLLLDRVAPTLGITASRTTAAVGEKVAFSAQVSDATSGTMGDSARWQWDDGAAATPGTSAERSFSTPGTHVVKFRMKDAAGNEGVAEKAIQVTAPVTPDPDPTPDPKPDPKPDPQPDPQSDPKPDPNDGLAAHEKEIAAAAGGGPVLRVQVGSVTVLAPKRFRIGKSKRLALGVRTDQAGELSLSLLRGKKTVARLSVGIAPGSTTQRLRLPKQLKPGTYSLKTAFTPSGASWSASGSAKIAFLKPKPKKK